MANKERKFIEAEYDIDIIELSKDSRFGGYIKEFLTEKQAICINLRLKKNSFSRIAECFGVSTSSVIQMYHRAARHLYNKIDSRRRFEKLILISKGKYNE